MTKKHWLCRGLILVLCLAICLSTVACSGKKAEDSSEPVGTTGSGTMTYTVQITAETGTPLEKIGVYVYTDSTMSELVWFAKTDVEGKLTFTDIPSDNFVAVLADVPAGYLVEEYYPLTGENTVIKLSAGLMEGDLSTVTYKLGDLMLDFSVTGPDGTEYTFSELLEQKKAIILNFWYLQCQPCKAEFPHLQEAYEQYSDEVIVLAMNPVNQDNAEIEQFRKDNGYTFPMMACDPNWEKAMQITAYPTTVVIDRYGYITLRHTGSIDGPETFEAMMKYFSAEEYEHTVFKNLEDMENAVGVEQVYGTVDNPVQMGVQSSFQVTVEPGQEMHYEIYRVVNTRILTLHNSNAYVLHNGNRYNPTGGVITIAMKAEDTNSSLKFVFGNTSKETQTYTVNIAAPKGSPDNPYSLMLDEEGKAEFTVDVPAGSNDGTGVAYTLSTGIEGVFSVEMLEQTPGITFSVKVTTYKPANGDPIPIESNFDSGAINDPETGRKKVVVHSFPNSRIKIEVSTNRVNGAYPAGSVKLAAELAEGTLDDLIKASVQYTVNVTDESGNPVSGARLSMTVDGKEKELSGSNGCYSTYAEAGTYTVTLAVPRGFTAKTTTFKLTEKHPSVSIKLNTIEKVTYTLTVTDSNGNALAGAEVYFNDAAGELLTSAVTDTSGKVAITTSKDSYSVSVVKEGYISDAVVLTPEAKDATVALVEGTDENTAVYTVNAVDYFGASISGMKVTFIQNGAIKATADVVDGVATRRLLPGTYTIGVAGNYHTPGGTLTEETKTATVTIIAGVTGKTDEVSGEKVPVLELGATYVQPEVYAADNYYLFIPETSGRYQFRFLNNKLAASAVMLESYQGNNPQFPQDLTETLNSADQKVLGNSYDNKNNTFVVNIREKNLGGAYIIAVKNAKDAVIVITRIGDAMTDETDIEPDVYEATEAINWKSGFAAGTKFTYIDPLTQKAKDVKYVKGADGFYHLNDEKGPVLYVNLGKDAPYLSMSNCMAITDEHAVYHLIKVIYNENGKPVARLRYNECMIQYVNARCANTDVYPLTDDLILMLQFASEDKGWANYEDMGEDYLFLDSVTGERIPGADPDLAWMYAVCYIEK